MKWLKAAGIYGATYLHHQNTFYIKHIMDYVDTWDAFESSFDKADAILMGTGAVAEHWQRWEKQDNIERRHYAGIIGTYEGKVTSRTKTRTNTVAGKTGAANEGTVRPGETSSGYDQNRPEDGTPGKPNNPVGTPETQAKTRPFDAVSVQEFKEARDKTTRPEFLSVYTDEELGKMRLFKLEGEDAGYAIKEDGDIVNVFNNTDHPVLGSLGVIQAVLEGGTKLDCYKGDLTEKYGRLNFKEVERFPWDEQYAPKNWDYEKYGRPPVIMMEYKGKGDINGIIRDFRTARGGVLELDSVGKEVLDRLYDQFGERHGQGVGDREQGAIEGRIRTNTKGHLNEESQRRSEAGDLETVADQAGIDLGREREDWKARIAALRSTYEAAGNTWTADSQALAERVFSEAFTKYVLHSTYKEKLASISKNGLDPKYSPDYHYADGLGKRLSFAEVTSMANDFGDILLRVKMSDLDAKKMKLKERETGLEINSFDAIAPGKIEVFDNGTWKSLKTYVEDSSRSSATQAKARQYWWEGRDLQDEINKATPSIGDNGDFTPRIPHTPIADGYVPITLEEADWLYENNYYGNEAMFPTQKHGDTPGTERWMKSPEGNAEDRRYKRMGAGYNVAQVVNQEVRDLYAKAKARFESQVPPTAGKTIPKRAVSDNTAVRGEGINAPETQAKTRPIGEKQLAYAEKFKGRYNYNPEEKVLIGDKRPSLFPRYAYHQVNEYGYLDDTGIGEKINSAFGKKTKNTIWLSSREDYGPDSVRIDLAQLDPAALRNTGQAEVNAWYNGNIPEEAIIKEPETQAKARPLKDDPAPIDKVKPTEMSIARKVEEIFAEAKSIYLKWENVTDFGADSPLKKVILQNKQPEKNGTLSDGRTLQHLLYDSETGRLDLGRVNWFPMVPETIKNASRIILDKRIDKFTKMPRNNFVYIRAYYDGTRHMVVVSPEGKLLTQYPKHAFSPTRLAAIDFMDIVGKRKEATPAGTSTVTAASQIAGSKQAVFQESGDRISQEKGKVEENIEKANKVLTPTEVGPAAAGYHDKLAAEWSMMLSPASLNHRETKRHSGKVGHG